MSFAAYEQYKDIAVEWLERIPSTWGIVPLFTVAWERNESNKGMLEDNLLSLSYGNIIPKDITANDGLLPESFETYQIVRPNDIVFRLTDLQNDKRSLRTAIVKETGIITSAYTAVCPFAIDPNYLNYLLRSYDLQKVFYSMGSGLRQSLKYSDIKRLEITLPPHDEQCNIAAFLDHETAKIDALISEQEKLISLLAEKRQAVISHAVTKGLNPDAPMKDSGVEWLGEVPKHWEKGAIKRFYKTLDSRRIPLSSVERGDRGGEFPYYGASGIIDWIDEYIFDEDLILVSEDGANLLNRSTPIAFIATGKYWVNNHAHILKPIDSNLVYWAERIEAIDLTPVVTGSAQPKLTIDALANITICVPPDQEERNHIQEIILKMKNETNVLMDEAQKGIDILKERRSALISAAVTGKIDVRNA